MMQAIRRKRALFLLEHNIWDQDFFPSTEWIHTLKIAEPTRGGNGSKQNRSNNFRDRRDNPPDSGHPLYRILVVDDEPDVVSVLKRGLEQNGFYVIGYTNPVEALSNFTRHSFDIVLTDIRMPQMNGLEFFKQLRAKDAEVLICFVTAYEQFRHDFELTYPEEQIGCFIPKPIRIDTLVSTISRKMEERESRWRRRT